jgi:Uma2 family endonuclease
MTTAKPIRQQQTIDEPIDYANLEYDPFEPEPMPDAMLQEPILRGLLAVLSSRAQANNPGQRLFDSSNTIVCYDPGDLNVRVSPDYYFAVGIDPETLKYRGIYRTWIQGKPPDFVLEVASPSTARNDETTKRDIYARMGVPEYWRYDPTDLIDPNRRPLYAVPLIGEILVDGAYRPIEIAPGPEGCIMGYSPALGVSLAVKDKRLVVYDHELGDFVAEFEEQERAKMQAQAEAQAERELRLAEQERRAAAENELSEQAATIERLEDELRRLRGEG